MINKNSPIPLYQQLKVTIKEDIMNGLYQENEQIPTETEIEKKYGVSRITVRSAVKELVKEGYLIKRAGKGTFVVHPKIEHGFDYAHSFSKNAEQTNQETRSEILSTEIVTKIELANLFPKFSEYTFEKYYCVSRLRLLDNVPMIIETNYFPLPKMEAVINFDFHKSLFDSLKSTYQISQIRFIDGVMNVDTPSDETSGHLGISSITPVILLRQSAIDENGTLLYFGKQIISGMSYIIKIPEQLVNL